MQDIKLVVMSGPWAEWLDAFHAVSTRLKAVAAPTPEDLMREIVDAEIVIGRVPREAFLKAEKLCWAQSNGVGFETMLYPEMIESDVVITNTAGALDAPVAEHAMALILSYTRGIVFQERVRAEHTWARGTFTAHQIQDKTACVIGLGTIGRAIVKRLAAFDVRIIAVDAQVTAPPEGVYRLVKPDGMLDALSEADIVVVALPLTDRTRGLVNAECFSRMKKSAYLVNIGRGPIVNEADLIDALKAGEIGGAGLDVFEQEPLPASSPLWDMPNVVIAPHTGGQSAEGFQNLQKVFCENLRRYTSGEPLMNVVDKRQGYVIQKG